MGVVRDESITRNIVKNLGLICAFVNVLSLGKGREAQE